MKVLSLLLILVVVVLAVAAAKVKGPYDGYDVQQIHIAQGRTPESMTISWVTKTEAASQVRYSDGTSKDLKLTAVGYSTSYKFDYPDYGHYESGVIHHVQVVGLQPNTVYYYQCGDFDRDSTSGMLVFKTLPKVGNHLPISFGVIGDLGTTNDSLSTVNHVLDNRALQMILHAGDLSYADCNQPVWDAYGIMIEDLAKERPWMVGPGNHEIELGSDGSTFLAFEERYKMPAIKPAEIGAITIPASINPETGRPWCASSVFQREYNWGNSFYSFEAASAHIIYLNPYSTSNETSVQYQWLVSDLETIDRSITPWVIVVMHCPWYNSNTAHYDEEQAVLMRDSMEKVFYKYHVNIVFTGHVHAYERTYPVFQNETRSDGVVYITIGDGGNREGHANTYYEQPSWSAYRNGTQYGHGELNLWNKDKLTWRWFRNVDGSIVDKDEVSLCNTAFHTVDDCFN